MRILRVIASMDPATGGPCQGIRYSIPHLKAEGCDNEVVCLDDPAATFLQSDPFVIHALGRGRGPLRYHPALLPWMEANLSRFDAVIVHGLWLWPSIATRIATQRLRKKVQRLSASSPSRSADSQLPAPKIPPYFVMPHGMLDPWFQKDSNRKLKALRNSIYWHLIENRVIRDASGILFTCDQELQLARISFSNYKPRREINVGYGVPDPPAHDAVMDQAFHRSCPGLPLERPFLLFLSRIHPKKGIDLLIRSYAEIYGERSSSSDNQPKFPALVIAGPIDSDYASEMIHLAESFLPGRVFQPLSPHESSPSTASGHDGLEASIHFTGMLSGDAKWGALYRCEAFVLPSHQENFGIAVVEAMACEKPVIVSDKVNIYSELVAVGAGISGADTNEGVLTLLERWKNTPLEYRRHMAASAKSCFQKLFKSSSAAKNLIQALQQTL
jgi:glycosyltransferase involved in cell wall biosynthesis